MIENSKRNYKLFSFVTLELEKIGDDRLKLYNSYWKGAKDTIAVYSIAEIETKFNTGISKDWDVEGLLNDSSSLLKELFKEDIANYIFD